MSSWIHDDDRQDLVAATMIVDESFPEFTSSADFSTGAFQHACGAFALVQNSLDISLLQAVDGRWQTVEGPSFALPEPAELADHRLMDVTGDGQPEVIMVWFPEFSSHTYGHVLTADSTNCVWGYAPIVRGCGADSLTADLEIADSGEMSTFEFLACWGDYRDNLPMVWNDEFGVFLTEPPSGSSYCESFADDALDLPLGLCSGGWAVAMGQEAIASEGIDVEVDARFGPGTRLAALAYQQLKGLELTGTFDAETWAVMYPVGGPDGSNLVEFPDFDGDGISSPSEINEATALGDWETAGPASVKRSENHKGGRKLQLRLDFWSDWRAGKREVQMRSLVIPRSRRTTISAAAVAATFVLTALVVVGGGTQSAGAIAPAGKHTICHRTHATTNPYRRITVSARAIYMPNLDDFTNGPSKHPNAHAEYPYGLEGTDQIDTDEDGALESSELTSAGYDIGATDDADGDGVLNSTDTDFFGVGTVTLAGDNSIDSIRIVTFDADGYTIDNVYNEDWEYVANQKKWGDIIPPYTGDGDLIDGQSMNWGAAGQAAFDDYCDPMSALDFLEAECGDAAPADEVACLDDALDDLTEQGATEDAGLKESLGAGGFNNLKGQTLSAITDDVEASSPAARTHTDSDVHGPCTVTETGGGVEVVLHGAAYTNDDELFTFFQYGSSTPLVDPETTDVSSWNLQPVENAIEPADMLTIAETDVSKSDSGAAESVDDALADVDSTTISGLVANIYFRTIVVVEVEDPDNAGSYIASWYYGDTELCDITAISWTLDVTRNGTGTGSVTDGADLECTDGTGACDSDSYEDEADVTLTADPAPGSEFTGWSGDAGADSCDDTELTCDLTVTEDSEVTATFDLTPPSGGGGGGGRRDTTLPPDPGSVAPPTTNPETDGEDDLTKDLEPQLNPDPNDPSGGGELEIPQDPNDPLQVTECLVEDPDYICEIQFSGPDYNKPEVWEEQGYGDECWKFEPGDYSYILPTPPAPPSGRSGGAYSTVIVKAGSLTSTDPNFRVNTVFRNPSPGSRVWPDNNMNGVFDPGGRYGDKLISHVIVCVDYSGGPTPTTVAPTTVAPTTVAPTTVAPTTAAPTTVAPTTAAPTTVAPTTVAPTTVAPTTVAPTTVAPTTVAPTTVAPTTAAPTTAAPTTAAPTTAAPTTAAPTTAAPTTAAPTTVPPSVQPLRLRIIPRPGSNPTPGPTRVSIRVTNGIDEETFTPTIDLRSFRLVASRPTLPTTGGNSGTPLTIALWVLVGGLFLAGTRRHLLTRR